MPPPPVLLVCLRSHFLLRGALFRVVSPLACLSSTSLRGAGSGTGGLSWVSEFERGIRKAKTTPADEHLTDGSRLTDTRGSGTHALITSPSIPALILACVRENLPRQRT